MIKTAVFPVAGFGTRTLPVTKVLSKEMLPVYNKPLIQYAVEEAINAGITRLVFITSPEKQMVLSHFLRNEALELHLKEKNKPDLLALLEPTNLDNLEIIGIPQESPKGLGHAVLLAQEAVQEDAFCVLLPDDLFVNSDFLQQMVMAFGNQKGMMTAVRQVPQAEASKYGILDIQSQENGILKAKGVVEKPSPEKAPSDMAILGRYILPKEIFGFLRDQSDGVGGEIQLTDAIAACLASGTPLAGYAYNDKHFDCGSLTGWQQANLYYFKN